MSIVFIVAGHVLPIYLLVSVSVIGGDGSETLGNMTQLSSEDVSVRLLYGDSHGVTWTDLDLQDRLPAIFTHMYLDVQGLDYHFEKRLLFYSGLGHIWRLAMNGSGYRPKVVIKTAEGATSVAVDWVQDRVYWVSPESRSVWRTSLMGIGSELFLATIGNLSWCSNVVLDPYSRLLYVALDGGGDSILRADMDGPTRTRMQVEGHSEKHVVSLALDIHYRRLYVAARYDHFPAILSCNYDGNQAREYDLSDEWWGSFPSIGVRGHQLFWVHHGWSQRDTVWKADIHGDGRLSWQKEYTSRGTVIDPKNRIWVLKVFHPDVQTLLKEEAVHMNPSTSMQMAVTCSSYSYKAHVTLILTLSIFTVLAQL